MLVKVPFVGWVDEGWSSRLYANCSSRAIDDSTCCETFKCCRNFTEREAAPPGKISDCCPLSSDASCCHEDTCCPNNRNYPDHHQISSDLWLAPSTQCLVARSIEKKYPTVKSVQKECSTVEASCPCGYGACVFVTKKEMADVCCLGPYEFKCCHNLTTTTGTTLTTTTGTAAPPSEITDKTKCTDPAEINRVCGACGKYNCVPNEGFSGSVCCAANYQFQCCNALSTTTSSSISTDVMTIPPSVMDGQTCTKEEVQQICGCDTYKCQPNINNPPSVCCSQGYAFVCCHTGKLSTLETTTVTTTTLPTTTTSDSITEETPFSQKFAGAPPLFCWVESACNYMAKYPLAKLGNRFRTAGKNCTDLAKHTAMTPPVEAAKNLWQLSYEFMAQLKAGAFLYDFTLLEANQQKRGMGRKLKAMKDLSN